MSVIEQLKRIYPSLITNKQENLENNDYQWFETEKSEIIGILKHELDHRSSDLLSVFLTPITSDESVLTAREKGWSRLLYTNKKPDDFQWPSSYRFVLFSIENFSTDKAIIHEAFQSLFPQEMPMLWTSDREGFIVEEIFSNQQEILSFEGIPDVLMSDFYTKIHFFLSEFSEQLNEANKILEWSEKGARIAKEHQLGTVTTYKDIIPYLYLDALPSAEWHHIRRAIFSEIEEDTELLQTIRTFLESGSNASLAAKRLYMHRNSLQYRVDKFIEKTGLDIKQFEGAVITYLALLHMDY